MVAVTYGDARVGKRDATPKNETPTDVAVVPRKAWYVRMLEAIIAARMQQAAREVRMYTQLLPYTVDENGHRRVKNEMKAPAGGW